MIHKRILVFLIAFLPVIISACSDDDDDDLIGKWYRVSDMDGLARNYASSFTIGNKGYLICGNDGKNRLSDCWEYDMERDTWTQKADFPGTARNSAVAMAVDEKGYLGTGYDGTNYLNDFWEFNPTTNTWAQKADFPGSGRYGAVAFGVNGKAYIGCGYDGNYLKDFYAFNPAANSWTQTISIGGTKRQGATSFVINGIAYVCCGQNNGEYVDDFWKFDPSKSEENKWTRLREIKNDSSDDYDDDYNSITRTYGCAFVIDGQAYITLGQTSGSSLRNNYWIYDPDTDLWRSSDTEDDFDYTPFEGSARTKAICFSTGKRGIITTGGSSGYYYDDTWELHPYEWEEDD